MHVDPRHLVSLPSPALVLLPERNHSKFLYLVCPTEIAQCPRHLRMEIFTSWPLLQIWACPIVGLALHLFHMIHRVGLSQHGMQTECTCMPDKFHVWKVATLIATTSSNCQSCNLTNDKSSDCKYCSSTNVSMIERATLHLSVFPAIHQPALTRSRGNKRTIGQRTINLLNSLNEFMNSLH